MGLACPFLEPRKEQKEEHCAWAVAAQFMVESNKGAPRNVKNARARVGGPKTGQARSKKKGLRKPSAAVSMRCRTG
jgi:hypothetical protein